jgi:putative transposase
MARDTMTAMETLRKGYEVEPDFLREVVRWTVQELMEAEVSAQIGAGRYERAGERTTYRNGYRAREWDTRVGTLELAVPKLRTGSYFPSWLEPRRRSEQALVAVVTEAYVQGVSTRKVEALVQSLGIVGISKSEVSRLCAQLDEQVEAFRSRRLDTTRYPYLWLDARYEYVREEHQVQSMAVVIAYGVREDGVREVLGLDIGPSEDTPLWRGFLQSLVARGLRGVRLVTSDAHQGLKQAIREVFVGAAWQRCRVHFMRNVIAQVPKSAQAMVAATVRTIFEQPDRAAARAQVRQVCATLEGRFPKVVALLEDAEGDLLTFYDFPKEHWRQIYSTNPLERLNKALKRRSVVVGIFPNRAAVLRLFGARLAEQTDEWLVGHRYFSLGSMAKLLAPGDEPVKEVGEAEATVAVA